MSAIAPIAIIAALAVAAKANRAAQVGSRGGFFIRSQAVGGREIADPVHAFNEISVEFLGDHYWSFFDTDDYMEPNENSAEIADSLIQKHWDTIGLGQRPVFVLHRLELPTAHRNQGAGRRAYEALEREVAQRGIGAIILQAGQLDDDWRHSLGFWRKMGFEEWPGDYWIFDDRIMVKVLP